MRRLKQKQGIARFFWVMMPLCAFVLALPGLLFADAKFKLIFNSSIFILQ